MFVTLLAVCSINATIQSAFQYLELLRVRKTLLMNVTTLSMEKILAEFSTEIQMSTSLIANHYNLPVPVTMNSVAQPLLTTQITAQTLHEQQTATKRNLVAVPKRPPINDILFSITMFPIVHHGQTIYAKHI